MKDCLEVVKNGGFAVIPTDTIYGVVASALNKEAVDGLYTVRGRNKAKPMIVLISDTKDLEYFHIKLGETDVKVLDKIWPGKVSVVFNCDNPQFEYLHRGTKTIAFRLPNKKELVSFLKEVGPLVAPSANTEGMPPALNVYEAKKYFEDKVQCYFDEGDLKGEPSTLISIFNGEVKVLRQGEVDVLKLLQ